MKNNLYYHIYFTLMSDINLSYAAAFSNPKLYLEGSYIRQKKKGGGRITDIAYVVKVTLSIFTYQTTSWCCLKFYLPSVYCNKLFRHSIPGAKSNCNCLKGALRKILKAVCMQLYTCTSVSRKHGYANIIISSL